MPFPSGSHISPSSSMSLPMQIAAVIGAWWALLQVLICLRLLPGQLFALNHHTITHKDLPSFFSGCLFSSWGHRQAHSGQLWWCSAAPLLCTLRGHTEQRQGGGCNGLSPLTDCAGLFLDPHIRHRFDWWELAFSCSISKWLFEVALCSSLEWLLWVSTPESQESNGCLSTAGGD